MLIFWDRICDFDFQIEFGKIQRFQLNSTSKSCGWVPHLSGNLFWVMFGLSQKMFSVAELTVYPGDDLKVYSRDELKVYSVNSVSWR